MRRLNSLWAAVATFCGIAAFSAAQDKPQSYPITLQADDVYEIPELTIESNGLTITAKDILAVPIRCELGVTGAMLLGAGDFRFAPADQPDIKGAFRAAMLRFDPADQPKLLPLNKENQIVDHAAHAMSQHLLNNIFRHCWHSGKDALIPDTGSFTANLYSKTHGDLLISTGPKGDVVYNFTSREQIYPQK